jgi:hypothetical protein
MTLTTPPAAAGSNNPDETSTKQLHRYNTRVEFPLKESISNAPLLLQKLLTTIVGHSAGTTFYSAAGDKIDIEEFPQAKADFDRVFCTTITEERNQRIVVGFEIRTELPFRKIKTSAWKFLTDNHVFLKKHPGPLSIMDVITLGWVHKAHPTYCSLDVLRRDIMDAIQTKIRDLSDEEKESHVIDNDTVIPDMYFSPGRANGTYDGGAIDSNVLFLLAERNQAKLMRILLEITFVDTETMSYIPSSLKRDEAELFGQYLSLQNSFLEDHRNISLVGISSAAMEHVYTDQQNGSNTLWQHLHMLPGVSRVDSCRRTADLGKWNISTTKAHYTNLTQWVDEKLAPTFLSFPAEVQATCQWPQFPVPRRLSRSSPTPNRPRPARTDTKSAYAKLLASRLSSTPKAAVIHRNAWRPQQPVAEVSYAFTETDFPSMQPNSSTDTKSTASLTQVSGLSSQALKDAINAETEKLLSISRKRDTEVDLRIQNIEATLNNLTTDIVTQIYAKLSGPTSPFVTSSALDAKLEQLTARIEQLMLAANPLPRLAGSPTRKQARKNDPGQPVDDTGNMEVDPKDPPHE